VESEWRVSGIVSLITLPDLYSPSSSRVLKWSRKGGGGRGEEEGEEEGRGGREGGGGGREGRDGGREEGKD
jgi:hypothetical protein